MAYSQKWTTECNIFPSQTVKINTESTRIKIIDFGGNCTENGAGADAIEIITSNPRLYTVRWAKHNLNLRI